MRKEFELNPRININQFLSVGFTTNKTELICALVTKIDLLKNTFHKKTKSNNININKQNIESKNIHKINNNSTDIKINNNDIDNTLQLELDNIEDELTPERPLP